MFSYVINIESLYLRVTYFTEEKYRPDSYQQCHILPFCKIGDFYQ